MRSLKHVETSRHGISQHSSRTGNENRENDAIGTTSSTLETVSSMQSKIRETERDIGVSTVDETTNPNNILQYEYY